MRKKIFIALVTILLVMFCLPMLASVAMLDKYADPPVLASSGSFESTYKTRMEFSLSGGTLTSAKWTLIPMYAVYGLNGTIKVGEAVSLSLTGTQHSMPAANLVFNNLTATLTFLDANGKVIGEERKYSSGNVKSSPLSHKIGASVPVGTRTVAITGTFSSRWATSVVAEEAVAVSVRLNVIIDKPVVILPVEPGAKTTPAPVENEGPFKHAAPLATIMISIIAAISAVLGGAGGSAVATVAGGVGGIPGIEGGGTDDGQDPAYERAKVPDYPEFIVGQDGEHITKKPDGNIEVSFPNGNVAIHFPNGTVQVKSPDGSISEEWPDGTVSTTADGQFIVKEPDGTMTVREPNGEETIYKPDGTSIHTNSKGWKVIKNAGGEVVSAERDGFVITRHPEDPGAKIATSPYGGSVVIREKARVETFRKADGKWEHRTVYEPALEGEMRTEHATHIYRPDGSAEHKGDEGSIYNQHANGSISSSSLDGTKIEYNNATGDLSYKFLDGSYVKGNERTGELDAKIADGSYWQRDAKGNGSFDNKKNGTKGVCREDGYFKIEAKDASFTQNTDGTMELQAADGTSLIQRADGTEYIRKPDGTVIDPDQLKRQS